MKVLIVGGVAGGATAAARLRRLDEQAEIVILERSGYISYANCGLPYYIGGEIAQQEALTLQTPESFWRRFRIDVRVHEEATALHPDRKTVTVTRLADGSTYEESYDKLILSPGARPIRPSLPGFDDERIFTVRTVEDTLRVRQYLTAHHPQTAVIAGGGYIGLEMAENLLRAGVTPTIVQLTSHVMDPLDADMAALVHAYLEEKGVAVRLQQGVEGCSPRPEGLLVRLSGGEDLPADMMILAMGVVPDTGLARDAGLALGPRGAILVDQQMATSVPDIYAVGDAVAVKQIPSGQTAVVPLAGPANKQGRIVADVLCGRPSRYDGSQGTSILKLFDLTIATTGLSEQAAREAQIAYDTVVTYFASHATYYPGATNMTIKTLFSPSSGAILGAQIVGFDGVDKRIDVLATAVRAGLTAHDLTALELAYAPPFSSAKDPVNMVGFVIENILDGLVEQYHWQDVAALPRDGSITLLDTRTDAEYRAGHLDGATHIPLDNLRDRIGELDPDRPVYVYCQSGLRSYIACRILTAAGFSCRHLSGGYRFYALVQQHVVDFTPTGPCGLSQKG